MAQVQLANDKNFEAAANVSILDAARAAGLVLEHSCRTGRCGTCKAKVICGTTQSIGDSSSLTVADANAGFVLTCTAAAISDVHLDIEDISLLADFPTRTTPCRIDSMLRLAPDVVQVSLRFPPAGSPKFLPGQYMDIIGTGGLRRSYSVANKPAIDGKVEIQIRSVDGGKMSAYWFGPAKVGDLLRLEGPKGSFFLRDVAGTDLVFLATGTGIAPIKAMLEGLADRVPAGLPNSITVIWGGRQPADLYWLPAVKGLEYLEYVPVLSKADATWSGARGHVHHVLLAREMDLPNTTVYACGSEAMIESAASALLAAGLPAKRFHSDAFVSSSA